MTLKAECVYQNKFINKQQAAVIVFEYIEIMKKTAEKIANKNIGPAQ